MGTAAHGAVTGALDEGHDQVTRAPTLASRDPADPDRVIWSGPLRPGDADDAVQAARRALPAWSGLTLQERGEHLRHYQAVVKRRADEIAGLITDEMGKVIAESRSEADSVAAKVDITLDEVSLGRVREYDVQVAPTKFGRCRFKPHGVMAVIGPFNFPLHLPNGQYVPALLMGNAVVFKPSEKTPAVGQLAGKLMDEAGLPRGVFSVVQGAGDVASRLVSHPGVDGILFTGSWPVGRKILEANLDTPGRIVALEMGGNNPAVVLDDAPFEHAVAECTRAGFATTGQRCTCTRRVIVQRGIAPRFIEALVASASKLRAGPGRQEGVSMGPVISVAAVDAVLEVQRRGRVLLEARRLPEVGRGHFISPGVIQVEGFSLEGDVEVFGPLVQVTVVDSLDAAIEQANMTRYGLAASIFTAGEAAAERFFRGVRAGCINWNTGTAGASGKLPFGGVGRSGNHRPMAAFAVDSCAYPVACMTEKVSG